MPTKSKRKTNRVLSHLKGLGFTNRLALYIIAFLAVGLAGGFYLAIRSISGGLHWLSAVLDCGVHTDWHSVQRSFVPNCR